MLSYIVRGVSSVIAVIYTVINIGLLYTHNTLLESTDIPFAEIETIPAAASEITTVHIFQNHADIGFELQQAINLYSKDLPKNLQFSVQTIGNESDYTLALRAKLLSGEEVDVFNISGARELNELEKYVREIENSSWISKAYPTTLNAVTRDNQVFGVPYSIEATGLICNMDIFEAAEISLLDIRSFEELSEAFAKLNDKIKSGESGEDFLELEAVCEISAQDKAFLSSAFADITLSGVFASPAEAAAATSLTIPEAEPVEKLVNLMAKYSSSSGDWTKLASVTNALQIERFASGKVAVILQDTNVYRSVNELNPGLSGRTFLLPVPLDTFELPSVYMGVPSYWALNVSSSPQAVKAATSFLEWLYQSDEGTDFFAREFGAVSPFRDTAKDTGVMLHSQMLRYLEADMYLPQLHREFPQNWGKEVFAPNMQSYFTEREMTWQKVITNIEENWTAPSE